MSLFVNGGVSPTKEKFKNDLLRRSYKVPVIQCNKSVTLLYFMVGLYYMFITGNKNTKNVEICFEIFGFYIILQFNIVSIRVFSV